MKKYSLEINEKQADIIIKALDFYARIGCGQFKELLHVFDWREIYEHEDFNNFLELRSKAETSLNHVKNSLTKMPKDMSLSILGPETPEESKIAYDILQVIRHCLAWNNEPNGGCTVNFNKPLKSSQQEFPKIKKANKGKTL